MGLPPRGCWVTSEQNRGPGVIVVNQVEELRKYIVPMVTEKSQTFTRSAVIQLNLNVWAETPPL